ncbi:hypothetical protein CLAIMM_13500 [Cladophialophora immunda]|nr:hypothetical protein CLAIMM_13500 [Cladophialophora immunda]
MQKTQTDLLTAPHGNTHNGYTQVRDIFHRVSMSVSSVSALGSGSYCLERGVAKSKTCDRRQWPAASNAHLDLVSAQDLADLRHPGTKNQLLASSNLSLIRGQWNFSNLPLEASEGLNKAGYPLVTSTKTYLSILCFSEHSCGHEDES